MKHKIINFAFEKVSVFTKLKSVIKIMTNFVLNATMILNKLKIDNIPNQIAPTQKINYCYINDKHQTVCVLEITLSNPKKYNVFTLKDYSCSKPNIYFASKNSRGTWDMCFRGCNLIACKDYLRLVDISENLIVKYHILIRIFFLKNIISNNDIATFSMSILAKIF